MMTENIDLRRSEKMSPHKEGTTFKKKKKKKSIFGESSLLLDTSRNPGTC